MPGKGFVSYSTVEMNGRYEQAMEAEAVLAFTPELTMKKVDKLADVIAAHRLHYLSVLSDTTPMTSLFYGENEDGYRLDLDTMVMSQNRTTIRAPIRHLEADITYSLPTEAFRHILNHSIAPITREALDSAHDMDDIREEKAILFDLEDISFLKAHIPNDTWAAINKINSDRDQSLSADIGLAPS